jgi:hypothetical protein
MKSSNSRGGGSSNSRGRPRRKGQRRPRKESTQPSLELTHETPLDRLKELCQQGNYQYNIYWDAFKNGYMMFGELYRYRPRMTGRQIVMISESQWVPTKNLNDARQTIAVVILHKIGLFDQGEDLHPPLETDSEDEHDFTESPLNAKMLEEMSMKSLSVVEQLCGMKSSEWREELENSAREFTQSLFNDADHPEPSTDKTSWDTPDDPPCEEDASNSQVEQNSGTGIQSWADEVDSTSE